MRTDTREGGSNLFIVIEEVPKDQIPYRLDNKSKDYNLEIMN